MAVLTGYGGNDDVELGDVGYAGLNDLGHGVEEFVHFRCAAAALTQTDTGVDD